MCRNMRRVVFFGAALAGMVGISTASAEPLGTPMAVPAEAIERCEALSTADLTRIQDAPTQVVESKMVAANGRDPAYCRVQGYVMPQVGFELRLPATTWNGKLLQVGDGGWGGTLFLFLCDGPLRKGYACIAGDTGHRASASQALWAWNNLQSQIDFGYRATHVTALAGKALVASYYAKPPARSLMLGCSTGGYQGMVEAQRFPWDFDGIVAVAPDMDEADLSMRKVWQYRNIVDSTGKLNFTTADLQLLHRAALDRCDAADGVKDGVIGDPLGCKFDPEVLLCKAGRTSGCLTAQQVLAAKNIYAGPMTSKGQRLSSRGSFPGSELEWDTNHMDYPRGLFKYALFTPSPGPDGKADDFDFDHDYQRLGIGVPYTDTNPDLRKLKAAGTKLIVAQGGIDIGEIPGAIFDYYDMVLKTMDGRAATQDFFRLFLVPGMKHCTAGDGAFAIDYLSYLEAWVEQGHAPDKMIGAHVDSAYLLEHSKGDAKSSDADRIWGAAFNLTFPLDPSVPVTFTRPVYPYPLVARYKGSGDPNDAANFIPVESGSTAPSPHR
jgi:hypothetical protein